MNTMIIKVMEGATTFFFKVTPEMSSDFTALIVDSFGQWCLHPYWADGTTSLTKIRGANGGS